MEEILTNAFNSGNIVAILCAVAVYVLIWFQRNNTASKRNEDSQALHDKLMKHEFTIAQLKDNQNLMTEIQEDIKQQLNILNTNVVKLSTIVDNLTETVKNMRQ